jgi:hypothetical protein
MMALNDDDGGGGGDHNDDYDYNVYLYFGMLGPIGTYRTLCRI